MRHAATTPIVKLGPEFASLSDFVVRMPHIPDISDLEHLTVSGDVYFGRNVVIKVRPLSDTMPRRRAHQCGRRCVCVLCCAVLCCAVLLTSGNPGQGTVIIVANEGSRIDLPDGSVLEDKVVTGHLRILEH